MLLIDFADQGVGLPAANGRGMYIGATTEARMPSLEQYMSQYDHQHTNGWNKLLHGVGIPIILAGILLATLTFWRIGVTFFLGGWMLLFAGHRIEGNRPAFFQGIVYFLVGPLWVAKEVKEALLGKPRSSAAG
jgi:uncharacterized membrane protein YGL010W